MQRLLLLLLLSMQLPAAFRAGTARIKITPDTPIWLSGYASRTHPSEGVLQDLWAKALALDDGKKGRIAIVTIDVIGMPRSISEVVGARVLKAHGLERSQLLLNTSHIHTGPVLWPNLKSMFLLSPQDEQTLQRYANKLTDDLVTVVGAAIGDLEPAKVAYSSGQVGFAMNRREPTPKGIKLGVNPQGPVDHSVPVLKVAKSNGAIKAVLFGYACHNTTLGGDIYQITGDYAGTAQADIEKAIPGASAMFLMLAGADQNPNPRGKLEYVQQHGQALADEVLRALSAKSEPVGGPIRTALEVTELALAPHTREQFEQMKSDPNRVKAKLAEDMLRAYDERKPMRTVPYPVQAVRMGKDLLLLALGGEVVVDYDLRAKREFPKQKLIFAGYSNDVMSYIPSARVLKEGGYEAVDSMVYYGMPGSYAPDVEDRVFTAIHQVAKRVGSNEPAEYLLWNAVGGRGWLLACGAHRQCGGGIGDNGNR
jgi:Neutral/alkaline non-lysosomal ceramidase.